MKEMLKCNTPDSIINSSSWMCNKNVPCIRFSFLFHTVMSNKVWESKTTYFMWKKISIHFIVSKIVFKTLDLAN